MDLGFIVSTDGFGNAYVSGQTMGSLGGPNAGEQDNFLAKYDAAGNQLWIRQAGTSGQDSISTSWIDSAGNVYQAMHTRGALGGAHQGESDIVVVKYDPSGTIRWATQIGTIAGDGAGGGIWGDAAGNLYIAGATSGSLGGPNAGGADAVLIKLTPPAARNANGTSTTEGIHPALPDSSDSLGGNAIGGTRASTSSGTMNTIAANNATHLNSVTSFTATGTFDSVRLVAATANRSSASLNSSLVDEAFGRWDATVIRDAHTILSPHFSAGISATRERVDELA
jgi:hypothetical protein